MDNTWSHRWLNSYGNQGLFPLAGEGAYVPGGDYWTVTYDLSNGHYYAWPTWNVPAGATITRLTMRCTVGQANGSDRSGILLNGNDYTYAYPAVVGTNVYDTGLVCLTGLSSVSFGITNITAASPGSVDSIEVYGIGPDPFLKNEAGSCPCAYAGIDAEEIGV